MIATYELLFNQETSTAYFDDEIYINIFLKDVAAHCNNFIRVRGYIYLNQIYEHLGFKWDPKNENPVFLRESDFIIVMQLCKKEKNEYIRIDIIKS